MAGDAQLRRSQQLPHGVRRHRIVRALSWHEYGVYVELRGIADSAHPDPGLLPRSIPDDELEPLVAKGAIMREDEHAFRCPELDEDRKAVKAYFREQGAKGKKERGGRGRFTKGDGQSTRGAGDDTGEAGKTTGDRTGRDGTSGPTDRPGTAASAPDGHAADQSFQERMNANGFHPAQLDARPGPPVEPPAPPEPEHEDEPEPSPPDSVPDSPPEPEAPPPQPYVPPWEKPR